MDQSTNQKIINPQVVYFWKAPLRAYKKRPTGVLRFYIAVSLLLSLIVFFLGDKILVLPIWAIMFLFYVLTITPPPEVENKITKFGIETSGNTFRWDFLSHFYFIKKFDYYVLVIVSIAPYYYHLYLVLKDEEIRHDLVKILSEHLIYQEQPQKTFIDKLTEWLTKLMPDVISSQTKENQVVLEKAAGAPL
jgi:hypothetical protein